MDFARNVDCLPAALWSTARRIGQELWGHDDLSCSSQLASRACLRPWTACRGQVWIGFLWTHPQRRRNWAMV